MSIDFPLGNKVDNEWFTGSVHMAVLDEHLQLQTANVTFSPGARTNWHSHPVGQNIIVIAGTGIYEEDGQPARLLEPGDVVFAAAGVRHWHGATDVHEMSHVVVNLKGLDGEIVEWEDPVEQAHYLEVSDELTS